jgi:hypothetical protein
MLIDYGGQPLPDHVTVEKKQSGTEQQAKAAKKSDN